MKRIQVQETRRSWPQTKHNLSTVPISDAIPESAPKISPHINISTYATVEVRKYDGSGREDEARKWTLSPQIESGFPRMGGIEAWTTTVARVNSLNTISATFTLRRYR